MSKHRVRFRSLTAAALGLAVALSGCGSNGSTTPTTQPGCTQTVVFQGSGTVAANGLDSEAFSTSTTGRLDVFLDWTSAANQMAVYVVQGSCTLEQFNARSCNFLIRGDGPAKPKNLSLSNVAPGAYNLLIANFSAVDESASASVTLSSPACPPASAAAATSQSTTRSAVGAETTGLLSR